MSRNTRRTPMNEMQRDDSEALRRKYARVFGIANDLVKVVLRKDIDAIVFAPSRNNLPVWTMKQGDRR